MLASSQPMKDVSCTRTERRENAGDQHSNGRELDVCGSSRSRHTCGARGGRTGMGEEMGECGGEVVRWGRWLGRAAGGFCRSVCHTAPPPHRPTAPSPHRPTAPPPTRAPPPGNTDDLHPNPHGVRCAGLVRRAVAVAAAVAAAAAAAAVADGT